MAAVTCAKTDLMNCFACLEPLGEEGPCSHKETSCFVEVEGKEFQPGFHQRCIDKIDKCPNCQNEATKVDFVVNPYLQCVIPRLVKDPNFPLKAECYCEEGWDHDAIVVTKCHHTFHKTCLSNWVEAHKHCPTCRAPIDPNPAEILKKQVVELEEKMQKLNQGLGDMQGRLRDAAGYIERSDVNDRLLGELINDIQWLNGQEAQFREIVALAAAIREGDRDEELFRNVNDLMCNYSMIQSGLEDTSRGLSDIADAEARNRTEEAARIDWGTILDALAIVLGVLLIAIGIVGLILASVKA